MILPKKGETSLPKNTVPTLRYLNKNDCMETDPDKTLFTTNVTLLFDLILPFLDIENLILPFLDIENYLWIEEEKFFGHYDVQILPKKG